MRILGSAVFGALLLVMFGSGVGAIRIPLIGPAVVRAASPEPSADSGDTRSSGEAPGFVGSPLVAVLAVLAIGVLAILGSLAYVRLTGGPGRSPGDGAPPSPSGP